MSKLILATALAATVIATSTVSGAEAKNVFRFAPHHPRNGRQVAKRANQIRPTREVFEEDRLGVWEEGNFDKIEECRRNGGGLKCLRMFDEEQEEQVWNPDMIRPRRPIYTVPGGPIVWEEGNFDKIEECRRNGGGLKCLGMFDEEEQHYKPLPRGSEFTHGPVVWEEEGNPYRPPSQCGFFPNPPCGGF